MPVVEISSFRRILFVSIAQAVKPEAGQEVECDQHGEDQGVDDRPQRMALGFDALTQGNPGDGRHTGTVESNMQFVERQNQAAGKLAR